MVMHSPIKSTEQTSPKPFQSITRALLILAPLITAAARADAQTLALTSQNCPVCDASMKPIVDALRANSFGVTVKSINAHVIGHVGAFKFNSPGNVKWR